MIFEDAGPAEIVRLSQKDEHFLTKLRSELTTLLQKVKGIRWWILWHRELELASDLCYFGLTTLLGNQTLGEEYVNVIQVNTTKRRIPQSWRRLLMILLHVGGPYATERWVDRMRYNLSTRPDFMSRNPGLKTFLQNSLPSLSQVISMLHRCHLLLFYFQVRYYDLAKRLTGTRYVLIRPWLEDGLSRWGYWLLGLLSLIQLLLSAAIYAYSYWSRKTGYSSQFEQTRGYCSLSKPELPSTGSRRTCPLCLEAPSSPTATPCGHVFCWDCILRCLQMKQQCPLCGDKFTPSRLVYLRNYD